MELESPFLISSSEQINFKLSLLFKRKCLITAHYGDNGDSFITTVLDIDTQKNRLIFYHSPKEDAIKDLLDSQLITFKTEYQGIKVTFEATRIGKKWDQQITVFVIPIPETLIWVEARSFYRVRSPIAKSSYCQLVLKNQDAINLKLYDISLAGFSMLSLSSEISELMMLETTFVQCTLILTEAGEGTIAFEVRSKYIINSETSGKIEKIGCQFTKITPAFENVIQRYILLIERESRQKEIDSVDMR